VKSRAGAKGLTGGPGLGEGPTGQWEGRRGASVGGRAGDGPRGPSRERATRGRGFGPAEEGGRDFLFFFFFFFYFYFYFSLISFFSFEQIFIYISWVSKIFYVRCY
jgi:hypothetical protein